MHITEKAKDKTGAELRLSLYDNEEKDIHTYGVIWEGVGFRASMRTGTPEEARALFDALQAVQGSTHMHQCLTYKD